MTKAILELRRLGACLSLMLLCSCAAIYPRLPADVALNKDAGRGNGLVVMLRLESGEKLPFYVDTGLPRTVLDKSLEPKLGKRLDTETIRSPAGPTNLATSIYPSLRLYSGSTPLRMSGTNIYTCDTKQLLGWDGCPVIGILGMDCLRHYCIQLDFKAGKMRFLDPDHLDTAKLGKAFPLTFSSEGEDRPELIRPFIPRGGLFEGKGTHVLIDTGCDVDGGLRQPSFQRAVEEQSGVIKAGGYARLPECVWDGETYTNLTILAWPTHFEHPNSIGLRFLARHLVTLDFPHQVMYLKRTRTGPLPDEDPQAAANAAGESATKSLQSLKKNGLLPGWSKKDKSANGRVTGDFHYPNSISLHYRKRGDSSIYHYDFTRASQNSPWQLQKAWRVDQNDQTLERYAVP